MGGGILGWLYFQGVVGLCSKFYTCAGYVALRSQAAQVVIVTSNLGYSLLILWETGNPDSRINYTGEPYGKGEVK